MAELLPALAVRAELEALEAPVRDAPDHDRARSVSEKDAGRAVVPVDDLRERLGADDQRVSRQPTCHRPVRLRERVHEAGAAGGKVVGSGIRRPELRGEKRAGGREKHVRCHRRDDDEVELGRVHPGLLESLPRCRESEVARRLTRFRDVALLDSRALGDPLVGGVHQL